MRRLLVLATAGLLLSGCGTEAGTVADDPAPRGPVMSPTAVPAADGPVQTTYAVTVLDDGDGAELCVGGVAESLPPQCGGPPITNWDWAEHQGDHEEAAGVRWGEFHLVGTFDGERFTASQVTPADEFDPPVEEDPISGTPCPEPDGGWRVIDPATTTDQTMDQVMAAATRRADYARSWVDQTINPAYPFDGEDAELVANDPTQLIVNVAVTGDVAGAEADLRAIWGGALCVSKAEHTDAELARIQEEVNELPGMLSSGRGDGLVGLSVVYDDGSIQAWADEEYGEGLVKVHSALVPMAG
ncbi:MAG: hypothetical protein ACRDO4_18030 [Nocardioides sp.]